jgi:hypothetical protein
VQPDEVADKIVAAIGSRAKDVYIPGSLGPMLKIHSLMGRRLRDGTQHAIGADTTSLDVDTVARRSYESRIAGGSSEPPAPR